MNDCINRRIRYVISYIVRLCERYKHCDNTQPYMEERAGILLDLLVKAVCVFLPEENLGEWETVKQNVKEILIDEYVSFVDREKGVVRISGGGGDDCEEPNSNTVDINFLYILSFFQYTYLLDREDAKLSGTFLWGTILLPYIHKVNKNSPGTVEAEVNKILKDYPIVAGKAAERKTLKILEENYKENKEWMEGVISNNYVIGSIQEEEVLSNSNKKKVVDNGMSGWKCLCILKIKS